ncbi:hypothetical protein M430DRAFT_241046 [Amorphotheca resinae ATCC 22711]|uniref:Uncharacterized protein n=1 Tax=Amorphotheca resinae ATCC 22711 TaxID=857342 RepID=A0A2T3B1X1_AMORE|nr:hypothetical protein M430DRAFT_241046 [Amorphotheca resinae ATCC 22711]PSS18547.1 hypothetical protein M430DRAFT_241046 [Amorphotheca resinae ATCC 22711]
MALSVLFSCCAKLYPETWQRRFVPLLDMPCRIAPTDIYVRLMNEETRTAKVRSLFKEPSQPTDYSTFCSKPRLPRGCGWVLT